jgi:hypothetical protein
MPGTANLLTLSITKIELLCKDHLLGKATGFFLKYQSNWFLVSNWHVFSGRDPKSGQPQDKKVVLYQMLVDFILLRLQRDASLLSQLYAH